MSLEIFGMKIRKNDHVTKIHNFNQKRKLILEFSGVALKKEQYSVKIKCQNISLKKFFSKKSRIPETIRKNENKPKNYSFKRKRKPKTKFSEMFEKKIQKEVFFENLVTKYFHRKKLHRGLNMALFSKT